MELLIRHSNTSADIKNVHLDNGDCYKIKKINNSQLEICEQNINVRNKIETVTVDYKNHLMTGFQFRKHFECIQYRWFNINTQNKSLTNSDWGNI